MTPGAPQPIAPGAAVQLAALAVALGGGLLVAALLVAAVRLRRGRAAPDLPVDPAPPPAAPPRPAGPDAARGLPFAGVRLVGAAALLLLLLPTAVAVRQLWPHPDLGWRLGAAWFLAALPPVAAWLVLAAPGRERRPGP